MSGPSTQKAQPPPPLCLLKIYTGSAIVAPGTIYKSLHTSPLSSASEIVAKVLTKYGFDLPEDRRGVSLGLVRVARSEEH
eukprot:UC4_evm1s680